MRVGLVLEGGAMRGLFSAGVLDVFMDNNIKIDGIIGVSAGALFGPNYYSKQRGRVIRYNKKYSQDKKYISMRNLIFTGNIISKKYAFYKLNNELDKFDEKTFRKNNNGFWAVATDVEEGKPKYFKITKPLADMEKLRASSAIPFVTRMVKIDGKKYLDGGIGDSIPIEAIQNKGYDKIIVILTQPIDYYKEPLNKKTIRKIKLKYHRYPKLIEAMINRYKNYNRSIDIVKDLEKKGKVFVIRPQEKISISLVKRNPDDLQMVYNQGVNEANRVMSELKSYLKGK